MNTGKEFLFEIGSSSNISAPLHLIAAHRKTQQIVPTSTDNPPANLSNNRLKNVFFSRKIYVGKYFVEIGGIRFPKDPINFNYTEKNCLDRNGELILCLE